MPRTLAVLGRGLSPHTLSIYDFDTATSLFSTELTDDPISTALHADGTMIAVGFESGRLHVYAVSDLGLIHDGVLPMRVSALAFHPTAPLLAVSAWETLNLIDSTSFATVSSSQNQKWNITCIAYSPSGERVATGTRASPVLIWSSANIDAPIQTLLSGHLLDVTCVLWLDDGRVVTGANDARVIVWSTETGVPLKTMQEHTQSITSLALMPSGAVLATSSSDRHVCIYETEGFAFLREADFPNMVTSIIFVDDEAVVVGIAHYETLVVSTATGAVVQRFPQCDSEHVTVMLTPAHGQ